MSTAGPAAVEVRGLVRRFGGTVALDGVDLVASIGRVTGVVGPNGSGKTTLLRCITGFLRPDAGTVCLFGSDVTGRAPAELASLRVAQTFQRVSLAESMSVAENVLLAVDGHRAPWPTRLVPDLVGRRRLPGSSLEAVATALVQTGLERMADRAVASLPLGARRRTELARAIVAGPRLLILDEPASGLDTTESAELCEVVAEVTADRDLTVVLVEHDMAVVERLCDDLVVLDFGRVVASGSRPEVLGDEGVQAAWLGQRPAAHTPART